MSLDNGIVALHVQPSGAVALAQAASGRRIDTLFTVVDERDIGDLYTPAPRPRACDVRFRGARRVHAGPLRGELSLAYELVDHTLGTGTRAQIAHVTVALVLDAESPMPVICITGVNRATDHRLRIVVHTDIVGGDVYADAAFGPVQRAPISACDADRSVEAPPPTAPLHRYVSRFTPTLGATLISDGLAEYQALDDGAVAITLVRAVGELSRNDVTERPGHAGWPTATPLAQCLGPFDAELALLLHGPRTTATIDAIERAADDLLNPITGTTLRSALRVPPPTSGVELIGDGLAVSAIKESEDGEWIVLRCVNLVDDAVRGAWRVGFRVRDAHLARLDETLIAPLAVDDRTVAFDAPARGIVTVLMRESITEV